MKKLRKSERKLEINPEMIIEKKELLLIRGGANCGTSTVRHYCSIAACGDCPASGGWVCLEFGQNLRLTMKEAGHTNYSCGKGYYTF